MLSSTSSSRIVLRSIGTVAVVAGLFSPAYFEYVHNDFSKNDEQTEVNNQSTTGSTGSFLMATSSRFAQHFDNNTKVSVSIYWCGMVV
jgi:hypothetical protein